MRIIKEGYSEHHKFTVAPDYVTIEAFPCEHGQTVLHLSRKEALEAVQWLSGELFRVLPEIIEMTPTVSDPRTFNYVSASSSSSPVYEPGQRTATQTVPLKVGDPNLAHRAMGGRTTQPGDGELDVTDLGALAERVGRV